MVFLLSNDDGIYAPGIHAMREQLSTLGRVVMVAPDRNRSGASNSLTLSRPLRVQMVGEDAYSLDGTPTDCVHIGITGLLDQPPDMVISGVNEGANMGDDVLYSGTVAAAMEGRFLGYPAMAVSLASPRNGFFSTAAKIAMRLVRHMLDVPLPAQTILNVNVPDVAYDEVQGITVTRLGQRHKAERVIKDSDPRGRPIYWLGPAGNEADAGPGTDFHALTQGKAVVSPLTIDMTDYRLIEPLTYWLEKCEQPGSGDNG